MPTTERGMTITHPGRRPTSATAAHLRPAASEHTDYRPGAPLFTVSAAPSPRPARAIPVRER